MALLDIFSKIIPNSFYGDSGGLGCMLAEKLSQFWGWFSKSPWDPHTSTVLVFEHLTG